jgi:hypothetical protein
MMKTHRVYLLHPNTTYMPSFDEWFDDVRVMLDLDDTWDDWDIICNSYDNQNNFAARPLHVKVLNRPGPVLLLEKAQRKPLEDIRGRLHTLAVVLTRSVANSADLWDALEEARRRFMTGEPFLPRKFVVAILIVRKLRKGNYWGGKRKGFLWHDELARGRGVDERFADIAQVVANDLLQHSILIFKTSQSDKKYALNPERKAEIHAIANDGTFRNERLKEILMRDRDTVSSRYLLEPRIPERFTILGGHRPFECSTVTEAIEYARSCLDRHAYEVRVLLQGNYSHSERFLEKQIMLYFLESFV